MTTVIKSCESNDYYVSLNIENRHGNDVYIVKVYPCIDECKCGYPEKETTYSINDKQKAYETYKRYIKKYCS